MPLKEYLKRMSIDDVLDGLMSYTLGLDAILRDKGGWILDICIISYSYSSSYIYNFKLYIIYYKF